MRKLALAAVMVGLVRVAGGQTVTAVPQLDLGKMMGSWYQIERLPDKREKRCIGGALVLFAVGEKAGRFQMVTSCQTKGNNVDAHNASGKVADKVGDGRLKVSYLWPFSQKYWVLALGPDYQWMLVGSPNHKTLWVLSRTATLTPETLDQAEGKAAAEGFNRGKLVKVMPRLNGGSFEPR